MKRLSLFLALFLFVLMGASCSLKPLEPTEDEDEETESMTIEDNDTSNDDDDMIDEMEEPEEEETEVEIEPEEEGEVEETPEPTETPDVSTGTGYGGKVIGTLSMKADGGSVVVFLTAEKGEYTGKDAYMEFGCESLLVPVRRSFEKTQSDLAHAIVELITIKQQAYADQGLRNAVAPSAPTIKLTNIHYDGKTRVIDFEGSFLSAGTCDDPRIKAQIEETVKLYASDYRIQLNGKESEWRCLFDQSGTCK